jgi:hypothetical protein
MSLCRFSSIVTPEALGAILLLQGFITALVKTNACKLRGFLILDRRAVLETKDGSSEPSRLSGAGLSST